MLVYNALFSKLTTRKQGVVLMQQIGIYEQLITQVIEQNLNRDQFYVGERKLETAEAATWLSRFLGKLVKKYKHYRAII